MEEAGNNTAKFNLMIGESWLLHVHLESRKSVCPSSSSSAPSASSPCHGRRGGWREWRPDETEKLDQCCGSLGVMECRVMERYGNIFFAWKVIAEHHSNALPKVRSINVPGIELHRLNPNQLWSALRHYVSRLEAATQQDECQKIHA